MSSEFANKTEMQNLLFAEFSRIFGQEVLLYDKSLLFKKACNQSVCALLARNYTGFQLSETELDKASGERTAQSASASQRNIVGSQRSSPPSG
ncbi:MAG: hypothetical protein DVB33_07335 [Verrucomicrobia bacterium]|jgi:hypothetical protein|nr:MAG: hypothetical protein DVB33_07335 [Verrucomicrobiota bacterium]